MRAAVVSMLFGAANAAVVLPLVTFDGKEGTTFKFQQMNDPVMGGESTGNWSVQTKDSQSFGVMDGVVVNVPKLAAPGFIESAADAKFNDVSAALSGGLRLTVRSSTPEYKGFRVSFAAGTLSPDYSCAGGGSIPFSRGCFKRPFSVKAGSEFSTVYLPFNTFSDKWSPATGVQNITCSEDSDVCPTAKDLAGIVRFEFWAEGAAGHAQLEVLRVDAVDGPTPVPVKATAGTVLPLVTFGGQKGTTFSFKELNDPVMGGKSTGSWSVQANVNASFGVMDGDVVNVPSLAAPGFIKSAADGKFNDVSAALAGGLRLTVRSSTPEYQGFRVTFAAGTLSPDYSCAGGGSIPLSRGCFKNKFSVKAGSEFSTVYLPFNSFSDKWSPATGEQNVTCAEDSDVCPTAKDLAGIVRFEFWAEGAAGKAKLEVLRVDAVNGAEALSLTLGGQPPADQDQCSGAVQGNLRYGISGRTTPDGVNAPVDASESLAEAVCCDKRAIAVAEPQFLYEAPDVLLFTKLASGVTTFYDSVCGIPLFKSPVNRTVADFKADTTEHGWPSFRPAEVFTENVVTDKDTKLVKSKCGTHLGTFLPDAQGDRWCIDLSCISGNPK